MGLWGERGWRTVAFDSILTRRFLPSLSSLQTANAAVVFQVIDAVEDKDIDGVLEGLDPLVMDLLMKYVYKGLSVR